MDPVWDSGLLRESMRKKSLTTPANAILLMLLGIRGSNPKFSLRIVRLCFKFKISCRFTGIMMYVKRNRAKKYDLIHLLVVWKRYSAPSMLMFIVVSGLASSLLVAC